MLIINLIIFIRSISQRRYNTIVSQAKTNIVGFASAYSKFIERVTIDQSSQGLITNYSRSIAAIALHFNRVPLEISVEEINIRAKPGKSELERDPYNQVTL